MKRIIITALCIIFILSGCSMKEVYELSSTEGRVFLCKNNTFMLIADGSPIVLNVEGLKDVDKYSDGDLISVWHDGIEETYPARTKAYKIKLIEKGSMADVDENVVRNLCDMGWIEYDDMVDRYISAGYIIDSETTERYTICEYKYCRIGLEIPDDWMYETQEKDGECYIRLRPKSVDNGWIVLQCTSYPFTVCGTGLKTEKTTIGGYNASVAYYDNNKTFSFISFESVPGEYVVRNMENSDWFGKYEKEFMEILETVILGTDLLSYDMSESKVNEIIPEYENISLRFDSFEGIWFVDYYIDSHRYQIQLNVNGEQMLENGEIE